MLHIAWGVPYDAIYGVGEIIMFLNRKEQYKNLESLRQSKVLTYITGDRPGLGTQIHPEVLDYITDHLDKMTNRRKIPKITLYLYTSGGLTIAAWSIVNLLKQFCKAYEVIIPAKAHSAGTIITMGANNIIMTKQATLSPIDPSINGPLNPVINVPNGNTTTPVSVEAISGFINFIKQDLGVTKKNELNKVLPYLINKIHPLVIGESFRAKKQIKEIANKLLHNKIKNGKTQKK
jgi:hypothetical protein